MNIGERFPQQMLYGLTYSEIHDMADEYLKRPPKPKKIGEKQAHEFAMMVSNLAAAKLLEMKSLQNLGQEAAVVYLQAYDMVEGWTKPKNTDQEKMSVTGVIKREKNFIELKIDGINTSFISVVHDGSACSFHIPKDA